jgi:FAD/FMN-containing dehydrogenase
VISSGDAAYGQTRAVYGGFDHRPAAIVRAADATDVSQVVVLTRERGLELAVRSGGHSLAGHGSSEGASSWTSGTCGGWTSTPTTAPRGPRPA